MKGKPEHTTKTLRIEKSPSEKKDSFFSQGAFFQPKLTVNEPGDKHEQEADAMADKVMRMDASRGKSFFAPTSVVPLVSDVNTFQTPRREDVQRKEEDAPGEKNGLEEGSDHLVLVGDDEELGSVISRKCATCEKEEQETIQRKSESNTEATGLVQRDETATPTPISSAPKINWFEMTRPFYNRGAEHLLFSPSGYDSMFHPWMQNYNLLRTLGFGALAIDATNFFTPFAIDSALKRDYSNWWETTDRELGTSSLMISPTLFNFDIHNIPGSFTMPAPFRNIFRLPENPYNIQRKCSHCEEEEKIHRKEDDAAVQETPIPTPVLTIQRKEEDERLDPGAMFPIPDHHPVNDQPEIFRKCSHCEEEENEKIQRRSHASTKPEVPESVSQAVKSSGTPMDYATRSFMESAMGQDFGNVQIHNDSLAHQSSKDINALAYTHKNHIVFGEGQYSPQTFSGKKLLAHELTHTIQQGGSTIKRAPGPAVDQPRDKTITNFDEAVHENQFRWHTEGHRYWNLLANQKFDPYSTPNAYVNEVWKMQFLIGLPLTGIVDESLLQELVSMADKVLVDPVFRSKVESAGFNMDVVRRVQFIATKAVFDLKPLTSKYFKGSFRFEWINKNTAFAMKDKDKGEDVYNLQLALLSLKYDLGPKGADAYFGDETTAALKKYQRDLGFSEPDCDGKLGYKTLQELDSRLSSQTRQPLVGSGRGTHYGFNIPVTKLVDSNDEAQSREFLFYTMKFIFNVTEEQAKTLVDVGKWKWLSFGGVSQKELDIGTKLISVSRSEYMQIAGEAADRFGVAPEYSTEMKTKELFWKLNGMEEIFKLNNELKELEGSQKFTVFVGPKIAKILQDQIDSKTKELDAALLVAGITRGDFELLMKDFVRHFTAFARITAKEMLAANRKDTIIEMKKYETGGQNSEGTEIKSIMSQLATLYAEADSAWWDGVSLKVTGTTTKIRSFSDYLTETDCTTNIKNESKPYCPPDILETLYGRYKEQERGPNSGFETCFDKNVEAFKLLQNAALEKGYKILAYPKLDLRNNAKVWKDKTPEDIEKELFSVSKTIEGNITETLEVLDKDKDGTEIWKLRPVIEMTKLRLGVVKDSVQDKLIKAEAERREDKEFWKSIGMAALGIGLGLLALASGPVGWAALVGSLAVGAIDAYNTFQDISFKRTAANTAFDPAKALSDVDPSYFWFYVSLASIGLDVFQGLKAIKGAAKAAQAAADAKTVKAFASEALNADKLDVEDALKSVVKNSPEEKALKDQLQKITKAIDDLPNGSFERNVELLQKLKDYPQVVVGLANQMTDPKIAEGFVAMEALLKKASLTDEFIKNVFVHYAGSGAEFAHELPDLVKVIQRGAVASEKPLLQSVMTDPRLQKVLLDNAGDPDLLLKEWKLWQAAKATKLISFEQFLKEKGLAGKITSTISLTEEFTAGFAKLTTRAKNNVLLQQIEPRLAKAFDNGKVLPKRLQQEFERIMSSDIIGEATSLQRAELRMKQALKMMGEAIQTHEEYAKVIGLIDTAAARKTIFDNAKSLRGYEEFVSVLNEAGTAAKLKANPGSFDEMIKIGPVKDPETIRWLIDNDKIRKLFAANPELVLALKKCASPCFPLLATSDEIEEILGLIKGSKKEIDYARLNQFMYEHRKTRTEWLQGLEELRANLNTALSKVEMPTAKDVPLPSSWSAVKAATSKTRNLIEKGVSPAMLENIYRQAAAYGIDGTDFLKHLSRAGAYLQKGDFDKLSSIFWALSSTKRSRFDAAYHMIKKIDHFANRGPSMADKIMTLFKVDDIADLRAAMPLAKELVDDVGDVSLASFEVFHKVASSFDGSRDEILQLIKEAGKASGESADLVRVAEAMRQLGNGSHNYAAVAAKLEEMKTLAAKLQAAGDNMGDVIWGVTKKKGKKDWDVADQFLNETGKPSGSKIIAHVKAKEPEIVKAILKNGKDVDETAWLAFKDAIKKTDLPTSIQNNIVGSMWERVKIMELQAKFGKNKVWTQVKIKFKSGGNEFETVVDGIVNDNGKILFFEYKTGGAKLELGQETMDTWVKANQSFTLEVVGPRGVEIWPGGAKPPASYNVIRDPG